MVEQGSRRAFTEDGRRHSRQREAIRDHLDGVERFAGAQQIYDDLRATGQRIGLATVYRTLQAMAEAGEVDVLRSEGEVLYRRCGPHHHHHLICRVCGQTVEITGGAVERWASAAGREHGYAEVSHVVELFGLCPACAGEPAQP